MKQIAECLDRHFDKKPTLKKKWQVREKENCLYLYHYHHLILIYSLGRKTVLHQWYDKPADYRGMRAAKLYLYNKFKMEVTNDADEGKIG